MTRLLLGVAFLLLAGPLSAQATVTSIFQEPVAGKITGLDVQGRLAIAVPDSETPARVPLDEIEQITFGHRGDERKPDEAPLRVYLVNGDVLYGAPDKGPADNDEVFVLRSRRLGEVTINVESVKRIEYVPNVAPNILPELGPDARDDTTWFAPSGNQPAQADPASSLVRVVRDGVYLYNEILDGDNFEGTRYAWNRIRGIVCLRSAHRPYDRLLGIFTLRDGAILQGPIKSWSEGVITVNHQVLGQDVGLEESNLLSVTMKNGRYVYLSDIDYAVPPQERPYYLPSDFDYETYLFKARRDQAQGGGPLSLRGRVYPKGLGVHAISRLSFDLNRNYTRFLADIGVDDSAGEFGSVKFKVYADDNLIYESDVLRRTSKIQSLDLNVVNVRRLTLVVTVTDNADIQARGNWANAKVVR